MRWLVLILFVLTSCNQASAAPQPTAEISVATARATELIPSRTSTPNTATPIPSATNTPTKVPTLTPTPTNTPTPLPTAYKDGRINCLGSVALMYHKIYPTPKDIPDGISTDIESFREVMSYLKDNNYYFPTPAEFSADIKDLVCERKYAIVTIDDSWNDPETMGVTDVLKKLREGNSVSGLPKVWFGLITRRVLQDQWNRLRDLQNEDLVYVVSHSQTHPATLVDITDVYSSVNNAVYEKIAEELGPSRVDILSLVQSEPLFFIYPGGNVTQVVSNGLRNSGYSGAFTVTPGGLDKSYPNYLPRINGGYGCDKTVGHNAECVIEKIGLYSNE